MDAPQPSIDSQTILDQGEQLLDSSRQLLAHIDDALSHDPGGDTSPDTTPGLDGELTK